VKTLTCVELQKKLETNNSLQLLDVRTPEEYQEAHLPHARLVPLDELRDHLKELDPTKETVVYCRVGLRGYLAARILLQHSFTNVLNLTGGYLSFPGIDR
jgi:tRNA 2-thiouridine synthesizing protein A